MRVIYTSQHAAGIGASDARYEDFMETSVNRFTMGYGDERYMYWNPFRNAPPRITVRSVGPGIMAVLVGFNLTAHMCVKILCHLAPVPTTGRGASKSKKPSPSRIHCSTFGWINVRLFRTPMMYRMYFLMMRLNGFLEAQIYGATLLESAIMTQGFPFPVLTSPEFYRDLLHPVYIPYEYSPFDIRSLRYQYTRVIKPSPLASALAAMPPSSLAVVSGIPCTATLGDILGLPLLELAARLRSCPEPDRLLRAMIALCTHYIPLYVGSRAGALAMGLPQKLVNNEIAWAGMMVVTPEVAERMTMCGGRCFSPVTHSV